MKEILNKVNDYLNKDKPKEKKEDKDEGIILINKDGLIERVNKTFVTSDGRQLIME